MLAHPKFVKDGQVLLCFFEACRNREDDSIVVEGKMAANIKPEIGKMRPVVIVHAHSRTRLAIVVPLTSQNPAREVRHTVHIKKGMLPGTLAKKDSWALCDMVQVVSLDRLQPVYLGRGNLHTNFKKSFLPSQFFKEIQKHVREIFKLPA